MKELSKEKKKTFIVATHDEGIVGIADRILKMKDGTLARTVWKKMKEAT